MNINKTTDTNTIASINYTTTSTTTNSTMASDDTTPNYTFESWEDKNIEMKPKLLRGIYAYGFDSPSPIQQRAVLPIYHGRDILAQAQSGTGKTGAFSVGSLQVVDDSQNTTQVIILAPTRELALQNFNVCSSISKFTKIRSHLLVGGTSTDMDKDVLINNTPHVVVGCPGRVHDMLRRGFLNGKTIKLFIMDEADEMLSTGFKEQVYNIFQLLSSTVQVGLFSATMPPDVQVLSDKFMRNPVKILVNSEMLTLDGIKQFYIAVEDDHTKYLTIKDLFQSISLCQTIIYCNTIKRVQDLNDAMNQDGFPVICIHSGMTDAERRKAFDSFKSGEKRVLISSDITARGIDIQQVSLVINFDVPKSVHNYLHRIGRGGRWGRKGTAINFVTKQDVSKLKDIESWYHTHIEELPGNFADMLRSS